MAKLLMHRQFYRQTEPVVDHFFAGVQITTAPAKSRESCCADSGVYVWFDGELYPSDQTHNSQSASSSSGQDCSGAHLLLNAYQRQQHQILLRHLDGVFCAVIYDSNQEQVHLISDRYGLRRLYWTVHRGTLFWFPEIKVLLGLPGYTPTLNREAIEDFLGIRYIQGNQTFLAGVSLLPAATLLTWDIQTATHHLSRYWWWTEIQRHTDIHKTSRADLESNLADLFRSAVNRRCQPHESVGLTLSGGLDSRAILAAIPETQGPINCLTYGQTGCQDSSLAQRAAAIAQAKFHQFEFDAQTWLWPRIKALWEMDAPCSMLHAQFAGPSQFIRGQNLFEINLHGEWGDKLSGDQFFAADKFEAFVDRQLNLSSFARTPAHYTAVMTRAKAYFESLDSSSYLLALDGRVRGFISKDMRISLIEGIETRFPFLDYELQKFLYAIPEAYFKSSALYHRTLIKHFPAYFETLPYQKTGLPLAKSLPKHHLHQRLDRYYQRVHSLTQTLRPQRTDHPATAQLQPREFADYAAWLRASPAKDFIDQLLGAAEPLYAEFVDPKAVRQDWENHLAGEDLADRLGTIITLEIWLNQFFMGKYRAF
ncbi:MAG: asparagine synthase-related protein [Nodosilinea sp.]